MPTNLVKKVAAIHDMCGAGRVSLTAVIPVLSAMGIEACPLPTALLSNHTQYPSFSFLDLTDNMVAMINEWKTLDIRFDAIYSGFLGSTRQIDIVANFIVDFRRDETLVVVDPVLGDNGKLYATFDDSMVEGMRRLVNSADVITPNLTEAFALLGRSYQTTLTEVELKTILKDLAAMGPKTRSTRALRPTRPKPIVSGASLANICRRTIQERATHLRAYSRVPSCKAKVSRWRLTAQRNLFFKGFAQLLATATTHERGCSWSACSRA